MGRGGHGLAVRAITHPEVILSDEDGVPREQAWKLPPRNQDAPQRLASSPCRVSGFVQDPYSDLARIPSLEFLSPQFQTPIEYLQLLPLLLRVHEGDHKEGA